MSPSRSPRSSAGVWGATLATNTPVRLPPDIRMPTPPSLRNDTYRGSDLVTKNKFNRNPNVPKHAKAFFFYRKMAQKQTNNE